MLSDIAKDDSDKAHEMPAMSAELTAPDGTIVTVMARWQGGVVFNNETAATLKELKDYREVNHDS